MRDGSSGRIQRVVRLALVTGLCLLGAAPAAGAAGMQTRYSLANGCYAITHADGSAVPGAEKVRLQATTLGRYLYAIGGNAEAARRAGVNLARIRTIAFMLCSLTAGIAGIVYASRLRSISTSIDGGTLVLYAVAAAVIGGTSLFGGHGKAIHGVLGGIVIAAIDNGMGLLGFTAASKYMVTALVLLAAVTIDALSRRGRVAT